jgi:hypothetical protein
MSAFAQEAIDQSNPDSAWTCLNPGFFTMSQTFTPTFTRMNFAEIHLDPGKGPAVAGDFSLRLLRNGSLVRESERRNIPAVPASDGYFRFSFPDEAFLNTGQQYELQLVNHSQTSYFAWCQSQQDSYTGGSAITSPPGGGSGDFLFRTGMQSIFGPPRAVTHGDGYMVFESALPPPATVAGTNSTSVSSSFFTGVNIEIDEPTHLTRIGGYFASTFGNVFGAVVRATGFASVPNPPDLSGTDVLATTIINPPAAGGDAFGNVDVLLQPGWYGVIFGSGKFGAAGNSGLRGLSAENGSWSPFSIRQSDGQRIFQASNLRIFAEARSAPGTAQARPAFDTTAQEFAGQWILTDGDSSITASRFDFFGDDERALMEFDLGEVPEGATITSVDLRLTPTQLTSGGGSGPRLIFHGYEGNGVASAADAAAPLNEIGATPIISEFAPFYVSLDADYVQSLVDMNATHLGLMVRGENNGHRAFFATWEDGEPHRVPLLTIEFTMPGDYNGDGLVNAGDYENWTAAYGTSGTDLAADGNGDGVVDAADYVVWRRVHSSSGRTGALAEAPAVPEPSGIALLMVAATASALPRTAFREKIGA